MLVKIVERKDFQLFIWFLNEHSIFVKFTFGMPDRNIGSWCRSWRSETICLDCFNNWVYLDLSLIWDSLRLLDISILLI